MNRRRLGRAIFAFALGLAAVGIAAHAGPPDGTPPDLVEFDFQPQNFDNTAGEQAVTITARMTDDVSGVNFAYGAFQSPLGSYIYFSMDGNNLVSGDAFDGVYEANAYFPQYCETGVWKLAHFDSVDAQWNSHFYDGAGEFPGLGFPTDLEVTGIMDTNPPSLVAMTIPTGAVNTAITGQDVLFQFHITGDLSGLNSIEVELLSPSSDSYYYYFDASSLVAGSTLNGDYDAFLFIYPDSEPGTWTVDYIALSDSAGRSINLNTATLAGMGMPTTFVVSNVYGSVSGQVRAGGTGLPFVHVHWIDLSDNDLTALTDIDGNYMRELRPGLHTIRTSAERFADEWYNEAGQKTNAASFLVMSNAVVTGFDFDLAPGQSPALADVDSDPPSALVYVDFHPTTNLTPSLVNLGDVSFQGDCGRRHTVAVKIPGSPVPPPQRTTGVETETVPLFFDMMTGVPGEVAVDTIPSGADVFVDFADAPAGIAPVTVTNLLPGPHIILLRKPGYLTPMPVVADVPAGGSVSVNVPLAMPGVGSNLIAHVQRTPENSAVLVDYILTNAVTGVVVDWLDAASHAGTDWYSINHTIHVRRDGYLTPFPQCVQPGLTNVQPLKFHLMPDPARSSDNDSDGLIDQWESLFNLSTNSPAGNNGALGDPDFDGYSNEEEMSAGTNPTNVNSFIGCGPMGVPTTNGVVFSWRSIPGRMYLPQYTPSPRSDWSNLTGIVTATGLVSSVLDAEALTASNRIYRAVVVP